MKFWEEWKRRRKAERAQKEFSVPFLIMILNRADEATRDEGYQITKVDREIVLNIYKDPLNGLRTAWNHFHPHRADPFCAYMKSVLLCCVRWLSVPEQMIAESSTKLSVQFPVTKEDIAAGLDFVLTGTIASVYWILQSKELDERNQQMLRYALQAISPDDCGPLAKKTLLNLRL